MFFPVAGDFHQQWMYFAVACSVLFVAALLLVRRHFSQAVNWWRKSQEISVRRDLILRELFEEVKSCIPSFSQQWVEMYSWSIIVWRGVDGYRYRSEVCTIRFEPRDSGDILTFEYGGRGVCMTEYLVSQREELLESVRLACKK